MFKFLAKSAVFSLIWTRYRKMIVSTAFLFGSYFIIALMHRDYLSYAKLSQANADIALSYAVKWAALLTVSGIYYWLNIHKNLGKSTAKATVNSGSDKRKPPKQSSGDGSRAIARDPFAEIRRKDKLSSKAEQILKK
ncbi:MAG: hypothetical protein KTR17_06095 [Cellvibrionaceae bacterium]|nr:hypothetical protein [Cellvibrionaceae bacterium]